MCTKETLTIDIYIYIYVVFFFFTILFTFFECVLSCLQRNLLLHFSRSLKILTPFVIHIYKYNASEVRKYLVLSIFANFVMLHFLD